MIEALTGVEETFDDEDHNALIPTQDVGSGRDARANIAAQKILIRSRQKNLAIMLAAGVARHEHRPGAAPASVFHALRNGGRPSSSTGAEAREAETQQP